MPVSHWLPDKITKKMLKNIKVQKVLDIGSGAGKYGKMVREFHRKAKSIGVEIDASYIEQFKLDEIYDEVWCMSAADLIEKKLDESYDLVIIGDCIEHLRKSQGIDLLNFLVYRTKYLLIHYPNRYVQDSVDEHTHEAHISFWTESDFQGFDYVMMRQGFISSVAINGYLLNYKGLSAVLRTESTVQKIFGKAKQQEISPDDFCWNDDTE
jgi:SAM-dependent methyltransferase